MIRWAENIEETLWATHFKSVVDYVVTFAELIVLAAVFKVAADHAQSTIITIISVILKYVVGMYVGLPLGFLTVKMSKYKTRSLALAIAIALPIGLVAGVGSALVSMEMSKAVEGFAKATVGD